MRVAGSEPRRFEVNTGVNNLRKRGDFRGDRVRITLSQASSAKMTRNVSSEP